MSIGHARAGDIDLEWLYHHRQSLPPTQLEKTLRHHGFEERSTAKGSSHRRFRNNEFGITCVYVMVHGGNDPHSTNMSVADACLQVREKWAAQKASALLKTDALPATISMGSSDSLIRTQDAMPDFVEVSGISGQPSGVILRLKNARHIGAFAPASMSAAELENTVNALKLNEKRFNEDLTVAQEIYEITTRTENDSLVLEQPGYGVVATFEQFGFGAENPHEFLEAVVKSIESHDNSCHSLIGEFTDAADKTSDATGIHYSGTSTHRITGYPHSFQINASPQGRVSYEQVFDFLDDEFGFVCGVPGEIKELQALLAAHGGYKLERSPDEPGRHIITHPYFPELKIPYPSTIGVPMLRDEWNKHVQNSNSHDLTPQISHRSRVMTEAYAAQLKLREWTNTKLVPLAAKTSDIRNLMKENGFKEAGDKQVTRHPGKIGNIIYQQPGKSLHIPCIQTMIDGLRAYLIRPDHFEKMEKAAHQSRTFSKPQANAGWISYLFADKSPSFVQRSIYTAAATPELRLP